MSVGIVIRQMLELLASSNPYNKFKIILEKKNIRL